MKKNYTIDDIIQFLKNYGLEDLVEGGAKKLTAKMLQNALNNHRFEENFNNFLDRHQEKKEQLETLKKDLKKKIDKGLQDHDRNLQVDLDKWLEEEFKNLEISTEYNSSIKTDFIDFVVNYLMKTDATQGNIIGLEKEVDDCRRKLQEKRKASIKQGAKCLGVQNADKFMGRTKDIENIREKFEAEQNLVILYGSPGIGKTTLAKKYANEYRRKGAYDNLYFIRFDKNIEATLSKLVNNGIKNPFETLIKEWENLDPQTKAKTLVIIDNFNEDSLEGDNKNFVEEMQGESWKKLQELGIHFLVTSRINPGKNQYQVSPVKDPVKLFKTYYIADGGNENSLDEKKVEQLITTVRGNTLVIILSAHLWADSPANGENLLQRLKECETNTENTELPVEADTTQISQENSTLYGQVEAILELSRIVEDTNYYYILSNAVLVPLTGMQEKYFMEFTEISGHNLINRLIQRSWIMKEDDTLFLHPVIREILMRKLPLQYKKCETYCRHLTQRIRIDLPLSEKIPFKSNAKEVYHFFKRETSPILTELFYAFSDICDDTGDKKLSRELAELIKDSVISMDDGIDKAEKLSGIAYSYNNCIKEDADLEQAFNWLVEAKDIMGTIQEIPANSFRYNSVCGKIHSNLGSNHLSRRNRIKKDPQAAYEEALQAKAEHESSLKYRKKLLEIAEKGKKSQAESAIATAYTGIATDYFYLKKYEDSVKFHKESLKIREMLKESEGIAVNQQRILGNVIKLYETDKESAYPYFAELLDYYPQILKTNLEYGNKIAFQDCINYFYEIKEIIEKDEVLHNLNDALSQKLISVNEVEKIAKEEN